jgi:hypothetical protein
MKIRTSRQLPHLYAAALLLAAMWCCTLTGCLRLSRNHWYKGPPERPAQMTEYYEVGKTYTGYHQEVVETTERYTWKHISIDSPAGPIVVDFFDTGKRTDDLVFVFPVLGGKLFIETHFAKYFAEKGIDTAIVNRSNEFKDPQNFDNLESIFRQNVIRDRLSIDFFENEFGKRDFGTFGISRGGINVAVTAGVDPRLKYNVMVLGGTDLVDLFRDSTQPRIEKYVQSVMADKNLSEDEFFNLLRSSLKTDPKNTAHYIDGRNALIILGVFDSTVPFSYGMQLREQLGKPQTIYLLADHYVGLLYTQTVSFLPPSKEGGLFPFPYIEEEAISFFRRSFDTGRNWMIYPYRALQLPFNLLAEGVGNVVTGIRWILGADCASKTDGSGTYWERDMRRASEELRN